MYSIEEIIGKPALLEQLAEEAAELAQAALKYSRILRGENPTPITEQKAIENLIEEYTDVIHCGMELDLKVDDQQILRKDVRWHERLDSLLSE